VSVQQQLREALQKAAGRVIDLFREWDSNGDGQVSKMEFRKVMPLLGYHVPVKAIDDLFMSFDRDGSGEISYAELRKELSAGAVAASNEASAAAASDGAKLDHNKSRRGTVVPGKDSPADKLKKAGRRPSIAAGEAS